MVKKQTKKKNAQDLTLRNLRALKKRLDLIEGNLTLDISFYKKAWHHAMSRIYALENASLPKTKRR